MWVWCAIAFQTPRWNSISRGTLKIVIPNALRKVALKMLLDHPTTAYFRKEKPFKKREIYWRPLMDQEIFTYVCSCYACQRYKAANHKSGILTSIIPSFLGEVWPADLIILPIQLSNKYLFLVIENLSRWAVTIPLPIMYSEAITSALLYEDIFKFGAPRRLITENGSNLTSVVMKLMARQLRMRHSTTSVEHPQRTV